MIERAIIAALLEEIATLRSHIYGPDRAYTPLMLAIKESLDEDELLREEDNHVRV
jgi:hypothetical protein